MLTTNALPEKLRVRIMLTESYRARFIESYYIYTMGTTSQSDVDSQEKLRKIRERNVLEYCTTRALGCVWTLPGMYYGVNEKVAIRIILKWLRQNGY